jgi:hypothetical protein
LSTSYCFFNPDHEEKKRSLTLAIRCLSTVLIFLVEIKYMVVPAVQHARDEHKRITFENRKVQFRKMKKMALASAKRVKSANEKWKAEGDDSTPQRPTLTFPPGANESKTTINSSDADGVRKEATLKDKPRKKSLKFTESTSGDEGGDAPVDDYNDAHLPSAALDVPRHQSPSKTSSRVAIEKAPATSVTAIKSLQYLAEINPSKPNAQQQKDLAETKRARLGSAHLNRASASLGSIKLTDDVELEVDSSQIDLSTLAIRFFSPIFFLWLPQSSDADVFCDFLQK